MEAAPIETAAAEHPSGKEVHVGAIEFAGMIDVGFAIFHMLFWRLFSWPDALAGAGRVNAAITQTLNVVLIYVFLVYGAALILAGSTFGAGTALLLAAGAGVWALRLALQFILFSLNHWASVAITLMFGLAFAAHTIAAMSI